MDATAFLSALSRSFKKNRAQLPAAVQPATWTLFMQRCLLALAEDHGMHVCAQGLGRRSGLHVDPNQHKAAESLFDFTLFKPADWEAWSLPSVIIEHENQWTEQAFLQDFWKLLVGYAPLRVMFGYAGSVADVDARVRALLTHEVQSRWSYPADVEDLVLLRSPVMPWPEWRILYRPAFGAWNDLKVLGLDGAPLSLAPPKASHE